MYRFHEVLIENQHVVWDDRSEVYFIGPDSEFRDSKIDVAISAQGWLLTRTRFIGCTIHVKRELKNFSFCHAYIEKCRLRGRFTGCDFGLQIEPPRDDSEGPLYYPAAGIVDTDLSMARLDGCRFINCDLSTLKLPRWPCFTVTDPRAVREQALQLPWPGDSHLIPHGWRNDPPGTVAVTDDARRVCKRHGGTEDELKAVVSRIPGVIM